jgi:hypothetical protein
VNPRERIAAKRKGTAISRPFASKAALSRG